MGMLSFQPFLLDLHEERIWKDGRELHVRRKPLAILALLAQRPGRLVRHEELDEALWGRQAHSESLLRTHVRDLRRALGEDIIETVTGRGYRFVGNVQAVVEPPTVLPTETRAIRDALQCARSILRAASEPEATAQ